MSRTLIWMKLIFFCAMGCFFLLFGVHLLISSYGLRNPFWFVMTFFASNLIILISAVMIIAFIFGIKRMLKNPEETDKKGRL